MEKNRAESDIKRAERWIKSLLEKIEKAEPYNSDEWILLGFEEDNWGGAVSKAVGQLVESGQAAIVDKETT